jgi:dCTP deaminase
MIFTGKEIVSQVETGDITLEPFSVSQVNPNSYNYRLGKCLKVFIGYVGGKSRFEEISLPEEGYVMEPGRMYLGQTFEKIGSGTYSMSLIGRSSMGRLGLFVQLSANLGHVTSSHQWTLEIVAAMPFRLYPGMIIGQVSFWQVEGDIAPYLGLYGKMSMPTESVLMEKGYDFNR